ncbi:MAG: phage virion morphogenesis protein [Candidatus Hydrothermae bacterium]|nr:phage virion morphogenesis protein [Candidatus Hydrothermae bacterium]
MRLFGDWGRLIRDLATAPSRLDRARRRALADIADRLEGEAVGHIRAQDLPWEPLSPKYLSWKIRKGYSENIYVKTATLFRAITSEVGEDRAFVGVRRGTVREADGTDVVEIARWLEEGTSRMPARPLWGPTVEENIGWVTRRIQEALEEVFG